jgi:tetratricopeptide (TPR) repeat protein
MKRLIVALALAAAAPAWAEPPTLKTCTEAKLSPSEVELACTKAMQDPSVPKDEEMKARASRAFALIEQEKWAAALADFDTLLAVERRIAALYAGRARTHLGLGDTPAAAADFRSAIKLDPKDADSLGGLGFLVLADDPAEALSLADRSLKLDPDNSDTLYLKAMALSGLGRPDDAVPLLRRMIELAPQDPDGPRALARIYIDKDQAHQAEPLLAAALKLDPKDVEALSMRAEVRAAAEDWAGALADDDQVIALEPSASAYHQRGEHRASKGDDNGALADFRKVVELAPDSEVAWTSLARQSLRLGESEAAAKAVRTALKLAPDHADAWIVAGDLAYDREDWPAAAEAYEKGGDYVYAAEAWVSAGQTDKVMPLLDRALKEDPTWLRAWLDKGNFLVREGRVREGLKAFDRGLAVSPADTGLLLARARARGGLDDMKGAQADLDAALAAEPKSASVYNARGMFYYDHDQLDAAKAELDRAIALDPKLGDAYFNRALVFMSQGRNDPAIRDINTLLSLDPKDAAAVSLKGEAYLRLGDHTRALEELNAALILAPDEPHTLMRRSRAHEGLGDAAAAAADKARALKLDPSLKED